MNDMAFLKSLGTFPHGLSLGSGWGAYELKLMQEGIVEHFVFIDISEAALVTLRANAEKLWLSDRIETRVQDFNFLQLPKNSYDLVCCQNMLHHIINLEECMDTINHSLTAQWIFVIDEAISENKMYWSDAKMACLEMIQALLREKWITTKQYIRTNPKVLTNTCPFECVRSADLYSVIDHYFHDTAIKHVAYSPLFSFWNGISDDTSDTYFDLLEEFDTFMTKHHYLQPNRLFGIYKKSHIPLLISRPWSDKEIQENIGITALNERKLMKLSEKLHKKFPWLYTFIKRLYFKLR